MGQNYHYQVSNRHLQIMLTDLLKFRRQVGKLSYKEEVCYMEIVQCLT